MEKLVFKTGTDALKRLIDGPLWSSSGRIKAWFDGEKFKATYEGKSIIINAVELTKLCYTSEPFNPYTCPDKAVVMCWDDSDCAQRIYRFWDSKNKCAFDYGGIRDGAGFTYYQLIPDDQAPWMVQLRDNLED